MRKGIAPLYIREYYRLQGKKVSRVDKLMADAEASKAYDLVDGLGVRWEVKYDRLWHVTGNVYIELQALESSQADKYLIFAGPAFVIATFALYEAARQHLDLVKRGGDLDKSLGVPLPLQIVEEISEQVIFL